MKIAVIADVHANLPALKAALEAIDAEECDAIFHLGDAVAIGPYPAECVDLIQSVPNMKCVAGNHDLYFVNGLPEPLPSWMSDGEVRHQRWTHKQLGDHRKHTMGTWPLTVDEIVAGTKIIFVHYGLTPSADVFADIAPNPTVTEFDKLFASHNASMVFFGHDHASYDVLGEARYINPGSLGCSPHPTARYTIVTFDEHMVDVQHRHVSYDDKELYEAFEEREVPEREFLYKAFFGGRFGA